MKTDAEYRKKLFTMEKLQAFALFHSEGLESVEQTYPEHKQFVLENKSKTYREVKEELLHAIPQC